MQPLVIVGSGLAAYMLAKEWRKLDSTTPLVMITATGGDFYSKPMLSNALTKQKSAADLSLQSAETMAQQLNATIITNTTVKEIDRKKQMILCGEESFAYGRLVLALGAHPISLALHGDGADSLISINHLEDYAQFESWLQDKKEIAILGTGLVGCELMNDLLNNQYQLNMISLDEAPLARFIPEPLGRVFQDILAAHDVHWYLGSGASSISRHKAGFSITLTDKTDVSADGVISAVGLQANIALAQSAGLEVGQAIMVNRYLQTSDSHIYALGDCVAVDGVVLQYVAPILQSARALAQTLAGEPTIVQYPPMPVVIKTPACPIVTLPPASGIVGDWVIDGEGADWKARFVDDQGMLQGFTLLGQCVKQRQAYVSEMQPQWPDADIDQYQDS